MKFIEKFANGFLCFGPATFVAVAFILSQMSQRRCEFIKLGDGDGTDAVGGVMVSAGLTCYQITNGKEYQYPDNFPYSNEHEFAQKVALATTIMGATVWALYFFASCIRFPPAMWLFMSLTLVATCICQGLVFKFFDTDWCQESECSMGSNAKLCIAACVFWGISSLMTCGVAKEAMGRQNVDDDDDGGGGGEE